MPAGGQDLDIWYRSAEALDAWLATAAPGDRFDYAHTPLLTQSATKYPVVERVAALVEEGEVRPHLTRNGVGCHYFVVRTVGAMPRPPVRPGRISTLPEDQVRLLHAILRAAKAGKACPSNSSFAQAAKLTDRQAAADLLKKLQRAGLILIEAHGTGLRRIIHVGSGKATGISEPPPPPARKKGKRK